MVIINMIGPVEQVSLTDHPVTGLYFMVVNVPQNLTVTSVSYIGKLKITVGADKELINDKLFNACMEDAFEKIFMPDSADTYLHRVGRAGRFGTKGLAITFVAPASYSDVLNQVKERFEVDIKELLEQIDTCHHREGLAVFFSACFARSEVPC